MNVSDISNNIVYDVCKFLFMAFAKYIAKKYTGMSSIKRKLFNRIGLLLLIPILLAISILLTLNLDNWVKYVFIVADIILLINFIYMIYYIIVLAPLFNKKNYPDKSDFE